MVKNTHMLSFDRHGDERGMLIAAEAMREIPFPVERIYYIYDVGKDVRRGFHSHRELEQLLICVHGNVKILTKTPTESETVLLDSPEKALYIGPMVWREMYDFSDGAVLLVLASKHYDEDDYIRSEEVYQREAAEFFEKV